MRNIKYAREINRPPKKIRLSLGIAMCAAVLFVVPTKVQADSTATAETSTSSTTTEKTVDAETPVVTTSTTADQSAVEAATDGTNNVPAAKKVTSHATENTTSAKTITSDKTTNASETDTSKNPTGNQKAPVVSSPTQKTSADNSTASGLISNANSSPKKMATKTGKNPKLLKDSGVLQNTQVPSYDTRLPQTGNVILTSLTVIGMVLVGCVSLLVGKLEKKF